MALPNKREWVGDQLRRQVFYGVTMRIVPGDQSLYVEIERAPDSAGAPDTANKFSLGEVGPFPTQGGIYADPRPSNTSTWWYRCRHTGPGVTAGNWTAWISGVARRLDDAAWSALGRASQDTLYLRSGVKGASDVLIGGSVKFAINRHNETHSGVHTTGIVYSTSFEQVPETRILPQTYKAPPTGNTVELKLLSPTNAGGTIRAVEISGLTVTPRSDDFHAAQNTTPGTAAGVTIGAPGSVAYCQLSNANATATTYKVYFDVNTTAKSGGGLMRVTAYKNGSAGGVDWTQVGQKTYDDGLNLTGEIIEFSAALGANYDIRLVVTYQTTPSTNATVVADRVTYDEITGGTETPITNGVAGAAILVQAVEKS